MSAASEESKVLLLGVSILMVLASVDVASADSESPEESWLEPGVRAGMPCTREGPHVMGHGLVPVDFHGWLFGRSSAEHVAPVRGAKFWYANAQTRRGKLAHRRVRVEVDADGRFAGIVGVIWDEHLYCKGQVFGISRWYDRAEVLVTAKGCRDKKIEYGGDSGDPTIELDCTKDS